MDQELRDRHQERYQKYARLLRAGLVDQVPLFFCSCGWVGAPALELKKVWTSPTDWTLAKNFTARCRTGNPAFQQKGCQSKSLAKQEPWLYLWADGDLNQHRLRRLEIDAYLVGNPIALEKLKALEARLLAGWNFSHELTSLGWYRLTTSKLSRGGSKWIKNGLSQDSSLTNNPKSGNLISL